MYDSLARNAARQRLRTLRSTQQSRRGRGKTLAEEDGPVRRPASRTGHVLFNLECNIIQNRTSGSKQTLHALCRGAWRPRAGADALLGLRLAFPGDVRGAVLSHSNPTAEREQLMSGRLGQPRRRALCVGFTCTATDHIGFTRRRPAVRGHNKRVIYRRIRLNANGQCGWIQCGCQAAGQRELRLRSVGGQVARAAAAQHAPPHLF